MVHTPAYAPHRLLRLALLLAVAFFATAAVAQFQRAIPNDAKRGMFRYLEGMVVAIDGKPTRLAPGANIRNRDNLIIVPSALPQENVVADYTLDINGDVFRVWLLSAEEAARPRTKPAPQ